MNSLVSKISPPTSVKHFYFEANIILIYLENVQHYWMMLNLWSNKLPSLKPLWKFFLIYLCNQYLVLWIPLGVHLDLLLYFIFIFVHVFSIFFFSLYVHTVKRVLKDIGQRLFLPTFLPSLQSLMPTLTTVKQTNS